MPDWKPEYESLTISELSRVTGIPLSTLRQRYNYRNWRRGELVQPSQQRGKARVIEGRTLAEWAEFHSVYLPSLSSYYYRLRGRGLTDKEIVSEWEKRYRGNHHG